MIKDVVLFGASSEFGLAIAKNLKDKDYKVFGIGRGDHRKEYHNYLKVKDYLVDEKLILDFLQNLDEPTVIYLNGYLKENRPKYYPSKYEIGKTIEANLVIPIAITNSLIRRNLKISKFVVISSIAAIKLRNKNFIYGLTKKTLEKEISQISGKYLIIRFGMIKTSMSKTHTEAPFTYSKDKAAELFSKKIHKKGIVYPSLGLRIIASIINIVPVRYLDLYEKNKTKDF